MRWPGPPARSMKKRTRSTREVAEASRRPSARSRMRSAERASGGVATPSAVAVTISVLSTSSGQSVTGYAVRKRQRTPPLALLKSRLPRSTDESALHLRRVGVGVELRDRERRDRREEVRVEHAEQRVADLAEVVVEAHADARGEQREGLDQPLDVRIAAARRVELEASGDLGVALREIGRQVADEVELALVVVEEVVARGHQRSPRTEMRLDS